MTLSGEYLALLDAVQEAACVVDGQTHRLIAVNGAAAALVGEEQQALIGRQVTDLAVTPEDLVFWDEVTAARGGPPGSVPPVLHSESLIARADGGMVHVERKVQRIETGEGQVLYLLTLLDQTARLDTEAKLERLLSEMRATLESTADGILVTELDGSIQAFNRLFSQLWRLPAHLLTQRDDAAIYDCMRAQVQDAVAYDQRLAQIAGDTRLEDSDRIVLRGGRVLERVTLPQLGRGVSIGRVYSFRDITERLASEHRQRLAAKVFESSIDAIFVSDAQHNMFTVNEACSRLMGLGIEALQGQPVTTLLSLADDPDGLGQVLDGLSAKGRWEGELQCHRGDGVVTPLLVSLAHVAGEDGSPMHCIGHAHDLTQTMADRQRIHDLAYRDSLTGLPNRVLLTERMEQTIAVARREKQGFGVLFIDLDRFKSINDTLGHSFGDMVLVQVAKRVNNCLRPYDTMARLGGDEFVVILHQADVHTCEVVGQRILELLALPFERDDMRFVVTCSIGVAMFPDDGESMNELITNADDAMYRVKENGRAALRFYQRHMNVDLLDRMKLDHAMREALRLGHFRLHYQPQVNMDSGAIFGAEALIRWRDEAMGEISPGRFIPVAEETGFIVAIGDWVMAEAVRQNAQWFAAGLRIPVSVNVSAPQFQQKGFADKVAAVLKDAGLPAGLLEIELTESILIGDVEEVLLILRQLADLGVRLAIDDFGTGYSSLAYLKRFPIQRLKIDRSFVSHLPQDESDVAITHAVINLGHALHLKVIAEGVETEQQRAFLQQAGCDEFQGFLMSPALPAVDFERLFRQKSKQRGD